MHRQRTRYRLHQLSVLAALLAAMALSRESASAPNCDETPSPGDDGYKARGNRCEGIYQPRVAGGSVLPYSFTRGKLGLPTKGANLELNWDPNGSPSNVTIVARPMDVNIPYQVRTDPVASQLAAYVWSNAIPTKYKITSVAALAYEDDGKTVRPAFRESERNAQRYMVAFRSTVNLSGVMIKMEDESGNVSLIKGPFSAQPGMIEAEVPITSFKDFGAYTLRLVSNEGMNARLTFRHIRK